MDVFSALDMLIRSTELGSFSAAARQLGLTAVAVGKQISKLEQRLGVQLVVRTTRHLALTEAGQRLIREARGGVQQVQAALNAANQHDEGLSGTLRVNLSPAFGRQYILPLMGPLLDEHPLLKLDWHFENRHVDLVAEGFDVGIAGGVALAGGFAARNLTPLHLVVVASPAYLAGLGQLPDKPVDLLDHPVIALRSPATGRLRPWQLRSLVEETTLEPPARILVNEPEAIKEAALAGFGIGLTGLAHAVDHIERGELIRLLPNWWGDAGYISAYYAPSRLLPAKTRAFVDFLVTAFAARGIARRLDGRPHPTS